MRLHRFPNAPLPYQHRKISCTRTYTHTIRHVGMRGVAMRVDMLDVVQLTLTHNSCTVRPRKPQALSQPAHGQPGDGQAQMGHGVQGEAGVSGFVHELAIA
jgi:hypothetical protein